MSLLVRLRELLVSAASLGKSLQREGGVARTSAHTHTEFSLLSEQNGPVQCVHLLTPHMTVFDGQTLDSTFNTMVEPALLAVGDTMTPEGGELNTSHCHCIS